MSVSGYGLPETAHGIVCTLKPSVDLQQDYFSLFGLQPSSHVDVAELSARYRHLQQAVHPDRFMRECDRSQRLAQQQAAQVNTAYQTLKSPLARAQYLLELAGQQRAQETTLHDPVFLMEQMELRERLDDASRDIDALDGLLADVRVASQQYLQDFSEAWQKQDWPRAQLLVDKLQFSSKLGQEIGDRQARLLDD
ncbi:MAG TPA: Fe-S protein assembly co-chaperone HscB [Pseudomonadales bacterium]|nr:Fe-S protein assembly co-chaperone HscB [Pseudomonadales bacterium]